MFVMRLYQYIILYYYICIGGRHTQGPISPTPIINIASAAIDGWRKTATAGRRIQSYRGRSQPSRVRRHACRIRKNPTRKSINALCSRRVKFRVSSTCVCVPSIVLVVLCFYIITRMGMHTFENIDVIIYLPTHLLFMILLNVQTLVHIIIVGENQGGLNTAPSNNYPASPKNRSRVTSVIIIVIFFFIARYIETVCYYFLNSYLQI